MISLFNSYFRMAFVASTVILVILAVRPFFKKFSNRLTCLIWAVVLFRLLCPFTIARPALLHVDEAERISVSGQVSDVEEKIAGNPFEGVVNIQDTSETSPFVRNLQDKHDGIDKGDAVECLSVDSSANKTTGVENVGLFFYKCRSMIAKFADSSAGKWMTLIGGTAWLLGLLVFSFLGFCKYQRTRKALKQAVFLTKRDKFPVKISNVQGVPMSFGILFPAIYVPESFAEGARDVLSDDQRKMILVHEEMHLRHHDPLWKVTAFLALSVHWWNPLVWIAVRCMNQDLEMACDENVLHRIGCECRQEYATTIFEFAKSREGTFLASAFGESPAEKRIRNVVYYRRPSVCLGAVLLGGILILSGCLVSSPASEAPGKTADGMDAEGKMTPGLGLDILEPKDSETENLGLALRVMENDQEITYGMTANEFIQNTDQLSCWKNATNRSDQEEVLEQWKQKDGEIIVWDEMPNSETYLYGVNERGMAKLFLRVGDSVYFLHRGNRSVKEYSYGQYKLLQQDDHTGEDQNVIFLRESIDYRQQLYTIEVKKDSAVIYSFTQKEEILNKVNAWAEKMGYFATDEIFFQWSKKIGIQCVVTLHDPDYKDAEYYIEMFYLGNGLYEFGQYTLATNIPKG